MARSPSPSGYVQAGNEQYNSLLLKKQMLDPPTADLVEPMLEQMEYVRNRFGISKRKFSALLGLSETHYPKILQGKRVLTLEAFLTFCRVFNYDISTLVNSAYLSNADSLFMELAMFISRLDKSVVKEFIDILANSNESESTKKLGVFMFSQLLKNQENLAFYMADTKLEATASFVDKLQNQENPSKSSLSSFTQDQSDSVQK